MPLNDPTITATCDECSEDSDEMGMCPISCGGFDDRNIANTLKHAGWKLEDGIEGKIICPDCVEKGK